MVSFQILFFSVIELFSEITGCDVEEWMVVGELNVEIMGVDLNTLTDIMVLKCFKFYLN